MHNHITCRFLNTTAGNTRSHMAHIEVFECEYQAYLFGRAMHICRDVEGVFRFLAGMGPASL